VVVVSTLVVMEEQVAPEVVEVVVLNHLILSVLVELVDYLMVKMEFLDLVVIKVDMEQVAPEVVAVVEAP
tara:strand:- start:94 stop:303 length:210 start_codon:yes stop_codon:yes gene_type:complete